MRVYSFGFRVTAWVVLALFLWSFGPLFQIPTAIAAEPRQRAKNKELSAKKQKSEERFQDALDAIRENIGKAEEKAGRGQAATEEIESIRNRKAEIETLDLELRKEFAATEKKLRGAGLPQEILDRHHRFVKHYEDNFRQLKVDFAGHENARKAHNTAKEQEYLRKIKDRLERTRAHKKHVPLDPDNLPFRNRKVKKTREPRTTKKAFEKDFPPQRPQRAQRTAGLYQLNNSEFQTPNFAPRSATDELRWPRIQTADFFSRELTRIDANHELRRDAHPALAHALVNAGHRQKAQGFGHWVFNSKIGNQNSAIGRKPVLLAYNDVASDVPTGLGIDVSQNWDFSASPLHNVAASEPPLFAQATTDLPTPADLAETPDVQFTDSILAKAQELGHKPVKIYEWVRNNIEYAPLYGSIQGADQCLQSRICNDMDTASLLIALLRASGISARYVYGTVDIPIEKAMNWVGGVTNPMMVGTILATNGVPAVLLKTSGNVYKYVRMEHVWVSAYIDYIPSRGAVHRHGDTWIPLDASFKQYTYTQGINVTTAVPFDNQTFADQLLSTATTNTIEGYVTNVNSALIQQTMQDYQTQVQNYIQQNHPSATVGDVIGKKEIIQQNYPILVGTLPYKTVQVGSEFSTVPDNLRETISFSIPDPTGSSSGLNYTIGMPLIAGKKITLSFTPVTANDEAVIESLLPQPNPDGTPIQPSQLPSSFTAYLINLEPELRIDGQVVATGVSAKMGSALSFTMTLNDPGIGLGNIDNVIQAGEYYGIGLDTGQIGANQLSVLKTKLDTIKANLEAQNYIGITKDDVVGDLLCTTVATYFAELDAADILAARALNVIRYRAPAVGMYSLVLNVKDVFGVPTSASSNAMMMDVDRVMQTVFSKDGNMDAVRRYMFTSGAKSSALEHAVPEQLWSTAENSIQGISAIKALSIANDQGIPIYTINQSNINAILPQLQLNEDAKTDIQNAVNAGKVVTAPKTNINFNGWIGCGYIITDPSTGAGAYMISGGANGVWLKLLWAGVFLLVCVVGSLGVLALVGAVIFGALIEYFGSQSIKVAYGIQNSYEVTAKGILNGILGIIASITLGAGLLTLGAMLDAALIPIAVFALAALILYGTAAVIDYVLFWSKNQIIPSIGRTANV